MPTSYYEENTEYQELAQGETILADVQELAEQIAADRAIVVADKATVLASETQVGLDAAQVAADRVVVAADKSTVSGYKDTVAADKATVAADKATVAADKSTTAGYKDDTEEARDEAEAHAAAALAALASFGGVYLGPHAADPTEDANGDPVTVGDAYWNTVSTELRIYNGTSWSAYSPSMGDMLRSSYDADLDGVIDVEAGGTGVDETQANKVFAGPISGGDAAPAFRALVGADLPNPAVSTKGGVQSKAAATHQFLTQIGTDGAVSSAQPSTSDISGLGSAASLATSDVAQTANNLSDLASASTARTNLGLAIGSAVQAWSGNLDAYAALGNWKIVYTNGSGVPQALSVGADKAIVAGNGASAAPSFRTAANLGILEAGVTATLTIGFTATPFGAGTKSTGTFTPDPANGNFQYATNGGAHTLAPPASACTMIVEITNDGSAGAITDSGFTKRTGAAWTTTNGHKFFAFITKHQNYSHLHVQALQ